MTPPPVAVGMPVYNGERYVAEAVESVLGQTHTDLELIISDNASTDGTEEICRSFAARDDRVRFIRHETNHGAAWNYNRVFHECSSPYFRWAAADDLAAPTAVARCLETLVDAPRAVLCYPRALVIDDTGAVIREHDDALDLRSRRPYVRFRHCYLNVIYGNPMFGLVRSDALRRTRGHGSYPSADYVLLGELALAGEIWELPDRLFLRREHEGMSRKAQQDSVALSQWLDPEVEPVTNEPARLTREYLAAVRHAELTVVERVLTYGFFAAAWAQRSSPPVRALQRRQHRRARAAAGSAEL